MQNNLMLCVRLAACTGAVVFAVLAVLFAYDKKRLPVCLGILFAICFALEQLPVPIGAAGEILRVIRMADAVLCVACGILPAFLVYLLLQLFGGRMPNGTAYQILRWILIAVIGFLFGCLLYRFVFCRQGSPSGREKRRKRQSRNRYIVKRRRRGAKRKRKQKSRRERKQRIRMEILLTARKNFLPERNMRQHQQIPCRKNRISPAELSSGKTDALALYAISTARR